MLDLSYRVKLLVVFASKGLWDLCDVYLTIISYKEHQNIFNLVCFFFIELGP